MSDSPDAQLLLKKRARRRLVGAVALAGLAAVILPKIMDEEPRHQDQNIQIRIPGQDLAPFNPSLRPPPAVSEENEQVSPPVDQPTTEVADLTGGDEPADTPVEKPVEESPPKPTEKTPIKPAEKTVEKAVPAPDDSEARRVEAILDGKIVVGDSMPVNATNGKPFAILIGAFSDPANVKQLQTKIGELGIKVYTEPLGDKTRVRAGPFPSREAAEKALEKIKRIGVDGVVAVKQ